MVSNEVVMCNDISIFLGGIILGGITTLLLTCCNNTSINFYVNVPLDTKYDYSVESDSDSDEESDEEHEVLSNANDGDDEHEESVVFDENLSKKED